MFSPGFIPSTDPEAVFRIKDIEGIANVHHILQLMHNTGRTKYFGMSSKKNYKGYTRRDYNTSIERIKRVYRRPLTPEIIAEMSALGQRFQKRLKTFDRRQKFLPPANTTSLIQLARARTQLHFHDVSVIFPVIFCRFEVFPLTSSGRTSYGRCFRNWGGR